MSAVYPEARADFDATLIRLYASPAPLNRTVVKGADLRLVPDAPAPDPAGPAVTDAKCTLPGFLDALRSRLGPVDAQAWLAEATLEAGVEECVLRLPTRFKAGWVRSHFGPLIEEAARSAGLAVFPRVRGPAAFITTTGDTR